MIKCIKCGKEETIKNEFLHYDGIEIEENGYICDECEHSEYTVRCPHCERDIAVN